MTDLFPEVKRRPVPKLNIPKERKRRGPTLKRVIGEFKHNNGTVRLEASVDGLLTFRVLRSRKIPKQSITMVQLYDDLIGQGVMELE